MKVSRVYKESTQSMLIICNGLTLIVVECKRAGILSPNIFGIFINDIVDEVKSVNIGMNIYGIKC